VAPDKYSALIMQQWFERNGVIETALVISNESGEIGDEEEHKKEIAEYLRKKSDTYGDSKKYEDAMTKSFKKDAKGIELLIVVDKLLTGFDAPRDAVLYLAKPIRDHNLLQAIARVNRIFENELYPKTAGYIIDYSENARNISTAMALFGNYDEDDVRGALIDVKTKINEFRTKYDQLLNEFQGVPDDDHSYIEHLGSDPTRRKFKDKFNDLFVVWDELMNLRDFQTIFGEDKFDKMQLEMKKFSELKKTAELRYGEKVDFKKYEREIARILDQHVTANEVEVMTDEIKIFDAEFNKAIDEIGSDKSRAEAIAAQMSRTIRERFEKADESLYEKFSKRIQEILDAMRTSKIEDAEALAQMRLIGEEIEERKDDDLPESIGAVRGADILYRNMRDVAQVDNYDELVIGLAETVRKNARVDWHRNYEMKRQIRESLDDYLYENTKKDYYREHGESIVDAAMKLAEFNHTDFNFHA
jgi:type I restriction enzyme R subunit